MWTINVTYCDGTSIMFFVADLTDFNITLVGRFHNEDGSPVKTILIVR